MASGAELRVHLTVRDLQPQFAAYLGSPTRARGYPPFAGQHALIVEIAPALMIERVIDIALKADPDIEPGILFVERQYGILELHGSDLDALTRAGTAALGGIGLGDSQPLAPRVLYADVIEDLSDQHAVILNRNRQGSMALPGETLLVCEVAPALSAGLAVNEAERAAPGLTLVDCQMIGAAGRLYMSGTKAEVDRGLAAARAALDGIGGREAA